MENVINKLISPSLANFLQRSILGDVQNTLHVKFRKYDIISICQQDVKNCEESVFAHQSEHRF